MVLQDATLPSSRTAGFLNEVAFLAPSPCHSTHWLLCDKQYKLGLSYTSKATHGCDPVARAIPPPFTHLQQPCRRPAEPYSGASYYHTGSGDQFPGLHVQKIKGCCLEGNACSFQAFRSLWEKGRLPCLSLLGAAVGISADSGVASPVPPVGSHS